MSKVLIVPGLHDSPAEHWQTWLEQRLPDAERVKQRNWADPALGSWARRLEKAIAVAGGDAIVVAHSFGCLAALRAMSRHPDKVRGALLVAPADPKKFGITCPSSAALAPIRTIVVGSENDPWMSIDVARGIAERIDGDFVNLGLAGHINIASGYGPWPAAERLIDGFRKPLSRSFIRTKLGAPKPRADDSMTEFRGVFCP